jgi:hypothetical protein
VSVVLVFEVAVLKDDLGSLAMFVGEVNNCLEVLAHISPAAAKNLEAI